MRKIHLTAALLFLMLAVTACGAENNNDITAENTKIRSASEENIMEESTANTVISEETQAEVTIAESTENSESNTDRTIKMIAFDQEIEITLYDTPAANALYEMLPLELTFEDFNNTEKISYLPEALPTDGEPDGCDPDIGDFCLYAPWGNLSVFYRDFRYSEQLIMLGHIDSGIEVIADKDEDFTAVLRKQ